MDVDTAPGDSFNKKIRNAQLYHYNFIMGMKDIHCLVPILPIAKAYDIFLPVGTYSCR